MKMIFCLIAAEALTQLICKAEIFDKPREFIKSMSTFTNRLLSCPYCISVWVATFVIVLYYYWNYSFYFVIMLTIHRGSNLFHNIFRIVENYKIDQILKRK